MKKQAIFLILFLCLICVFGCATINLQAESYLRIHIRANSNVDADQNVKYLVKESVVNYLTPYIANCNNLQQVKQVVTNNLNGLKQVADQVLTNNNYNYESTVKLNNEFFPTRYYNGLMLEANYYDALIIELGSGQGDNWWCVVYPPLCFLNSTQNNSNQVEYKSKIVELINKFFEN